MELFRVPLWDMPLVASVNRLQWDMEADFTPASKQIWPSDSGRKKAIEVYERRKEDHWKHPVTGYSLSYVRLIKLEARLLEKEWAGEPGLFAHMRLVERSGHPCGAGNYLCFCEPAPCFARETGNFQEVRGGRSWGILRGGVGAE